AHRRGHRALRRPGGRRQDHLRRHDRRLRAGGGVSGAGAAGVGGGRLHAPFFVRGEVIADAAVTHTSRDLGADFTTPALDLDRVVQPRSELPPLLDVKLAEIIDFLVEAGTALDLDRNPYLQE